MEWQIRLFIKLRLLYNILHPQVLNRVVNYIRFKFFIELIH